MENNLLTQYEILYTNPVFLASLCSWFSAQLIKTIICLARRRVKNLSDLFLLLVWRTGGMPSSHSALVTAMTTGIAFHSGVGSDVFVLSCCFMLVVVRDAVGVRRSSGVQARVLNEIGGTLEQKKFLDFRPVKEVNGHKPAEVVAGILLGFAVGIAFSL